MSNKDVFIFLLLIQTFLSMLSLFWVADKFLDADLCADKPFGFAKRGDKLEHPMGIILRKLGNILIFIFCIALPYITIPYLIYRWYRDTAQAYYESKGEYHD